LVAIWQGRSAACAGPTTVAIATTPAPANSAAPVTAEKSLRLSFTFSPFHVTLSLQE
jgi:hypothetical protein